MFSLYLRQSWTITSQYVLAISKLAATGAKQQMKINGLVVKLAWVMPKAKGSLHNELIHAVGKLANAVVAKPAELAKARRYTSHVGSHNKSHENETTELR